MITCAAVSTGAKRPVMSDHRSQRPMLEEPDVEALGRAGEAGRGDEHERRRGEHREDDAEQPESHGQEPSDRPLHEEELGQLPARPVSPGDDHGLEYESRQENPADRSQSTHIPSRPENAENPVNNNVAHRDRLVYLAFP